MDYKEYNLLNTGLVQDMWEISKDDFTNKKNIKSNPLHSVQG